MVVDIYTEFNRDVKKLWTNFEKNAIMTPFQSYAWLSHWQQAVGGPLLYFKPQIVHVHDNTETYAILPLGIRKNFRINILEWMGGVNTDYMGPLIHSEYLNGSENKYLWNTIESKLKNYDIIHFYKQLEHTVQFLDRIGFSFNSNKGIKVSKAELPINWDKYYNNIKKKLRSDSRRRRRRLEEIGEISIIYSEKPEDKTEIIKSMITQKSRRYRETGVWDMLAVKEYRDFYRGLANLNTENFKVHCAVLLVDKIKVATHVGFVDDTTFYHLMPAHEGGDWEKYSPSRLLLLDMIKWSIGKNLKFFDFTVGEDAYKKDWCNINGNLFDCLKPTTIKGIILFISRKTIQAIKDIQWLNKKARRLRSWLININILK